MLPLRVCAWALCRSLSLPLPLAAAGEPVSGGVAPSQLTGVRAALRLSRYSLARCAAVGRLVMHLATLPETFEMARVTGLPLEMVRAE